MSALDRDDLTIEIEGCRHLVINADRPQYGMGYWNYGIDIRLDDEHKLGAGKIGRIDAEDTMCLVTMRPCILYSSKDRKLDFTNATRCPSFVNEVEIYTVTARGSPYARGYKFTASKIIRNS